MNSDELKLRAETYVNKLIDMYAPIDNLQCRIINSTMKFWIKQNKDKLFKIIDAFSSNNEINEYDLKEYIMNTFFIDNQFSLNIREMIPNEWGIIKDFMPDKLIILNENDVNNLLYQ